MFSSKKDFHSVSYSVVEKVWCLLIKKKDGWQRNTSPKHKIEILSKVTDEGKEKMIRVPSNKTGEYILKHATSEMVMEN